MYEENDEGTGDGDPKPPDLKPPCTARKRFTKDEDKLLKSLAESGELTNWEDISKRMPGRTARQCRDRYNNYLFKELTNEPFTPEEDQTILRMYKEIGPKWAQIAKTLHGRSGNNVKNRWYKFLIKRQKTTDPVREDKSEIFDIVRTEIFEPPKPDTWIDISIGSDVFDFDFGLF